MKVNDLQVKQFGRPMGKSGMQIVGSKLLLTTELHLAIFHPVARSCLRLRMVVSSLKR